MLVLPNSLLLGSLHPENSPPATHPLHSDFSVRNSDPAVQARAAPSQQKLAASGRDMLHVPRDACAGRARCCARRARHTSRAQRSSLSARRRRRQVELRGAARALVCSSSRARIPQHAMRPRGGLSPTTPTLSPPGGLSPARRARRARSRCAPPARPPPLVRRAASRKAPSSPLPTHLTLAPTFPLAGLLQLPDPVGGGDMAVDMAQLS